MQSRQCLTRPGSGTAGSLRARQLWHFMSAVYHKLTRDITGARDTHARDKRNKTTRQQKRDSESRLTKLECIYLRGFASAPFHLSYLSISLSPPPLLPYPRSYPLRRHPYLRTTSSLSRISLQVLEQGTSSGRRNFRGNSYSSGRTYRARSFRKLRSELDKDLGKRISERTERERERENSCSR